MSRVGRRTLNEKYLLGEEIGRGAYGRVFKGVDLQNGDIVAIKQVSLENIPSEELGTIMLEIDLLKMLRHRNVVRYLGSFKTRNHLYIILEFVEGGALSSAIKPSKFGALPESLAAMYIAQVLEGLVYLHEQGVLHRDIKAANILVTKEGTAKLGDFGVATKLTEGDKKMHSVVGSPYWMAPEVIEMSGWSSSSDIWSVGCTIIELLTSYPPYFDLQPMPALFRIVQDDLPKLPDNCSPGCEDFLHQCFRKDATLRPDARTLLNHPWIRNAKKKGRQHRLHSSRMPSAGKRSARANGESAQQLDAGSPESQSPPVTTPRVQDAGARSRASSLWEQGAANGGADGGTGGAGAPPGSNGVASGRLSASAKGKNKAPPEGASDESAQAAGHGREALSVGAGGAAAAQSAAPADVAGGGPYDPTRLEARLEAMRTEQRFNPEDVPLLDAGLQLRTEQLAPQAGRLQQLADVDRLDLPSLFEGQPWAVASAPGVTLGDQLRARLAKHRRELRAAAAAAQEAASSAADAEADPFAAIMGEEDVEYESQERARGSDSADPHGRNAQEINQQLALLRPDKREGVVLSACQKLVAFFKEYPSTKRHLITHRGVIPIMEMLDVPNPQILNAVLSVVNQAIEDNAELIENLCLVGLVPTVMRFAGSTMRPIRIQAAEFVRQMLATSTLTLQMFIACRGLPVLVTFLDYDYEENRDIVFMAIDGIWKVFELLSPTPKNDFARLFSKCGLLERLVDVLAAINGERKSLEAEEVAANRRGGANDGQSHPGAVENGAEGARVGGGGAVEREKARASASLRRCCEYIEKVVDLLLVFSHADEVVKSQMCVLPLLHRLYKTLDSLEMDVLVKVLKSIKQLSTEPTTLDDLQRAGTIKRLVPFLAESSAAAGAEMHNQVLNSMYNLCKINKTRQEQAAVAGIVPHLRRFVSTNSPLKHFALPLLLDMAHASRRTRAELWRHSGLQFYIDLLSQEFWQVTSLDSISVWLVNEPERVEAALLQPDALQRLVDLFARLSGAPFVAALDPFLRVITKSRRMNVALATSGLAPALISRLEEHNLSAEGQLKILKMIKITYEHYPKPKQLIVQHNLAGQLRSLLERERDGELLLVQQMARGLLNALLVNSVL